MSKYKLTNKSVAHWSGKTLFQIEATASFGSISKGDLGGYIEKESNLSQDGDAWVSGNARVYGDARVYGNAWVYGNALVSGKLELTLGYFFGMKYKGESIQEIEQGENKIICKGDVRVKKYDEPEVRSLSGQTVEVKVGDKTCKVIIQ